MRTDGTPAGEVSGALVLGRCIARGGPVLATEADALIGSITVTRQLCKLV